MLQAPFVFQSRKHAAWVVSVLVDVQSRRKPKMPKALGRCLGAHLQVLVFSSANCGVPKQHFLLGLLEPSTLKLSECWPFSRAAAAQQARRRNRAAQGRLASLQTTLNTLYYAGVHSNLYKLLSILKIARQH